MGNFFKIFLEKKGDWTIALFEHLQISLLSLMLAIIIAIPCAIGISHRKKLSEWILHITGVIQTIPSLALLGFFIPFLGIGMVPAVLALVLYAIFPILQNTITALQEIDPSLEEAATAFGMTKWEKLKKFELALAMPIIISGVRTSAVMIIGTATLAALIGAGGLGSFILLGIDRNNGNLILMGAMTSACLAILFNAGIRILEKQKLRRILFVFLGILAILVFSFFSKTMKREEELIIAGKLGAEPEIIIHMYQELIETETDLKVELKANFGKTSFLYEALKKGDIDIYPEFTGTIASSLLKEKEAVSNIPEEVYELAKTKIYEQDHLVLLKPMKFQNTYALAVPEEFAKEKKLDKISDLKKVEKDIIAGFTLEFHDREDGNQGLKKIYGLDFKVKTMEPSLRYQAIQHGDIQILDAYSTDSELLKYKLVLLKDDRQLFPPYQGAAFMREETLQKYPELRNILEKISGKITEEEMQRMNYEVDVKGRTAKEVAREYLVKNGILQEKIF